MNEPAEIVPVQAIEPRAELAVPDPVQPLNLFGAADPVEVIERASRVASALKNVVEAQGLVANISGKAYPQVEAWVMLGSMLGVFASTVWTRRVDNGWEARVEARTLAGDLVGAGEAQCTHEEKSGNKQPWLNRPDYALRAMAQTRATSRALRQPLGFLMVLAGYEATPEAEMPQASGGHLMDPYGSDSPYPDRSAAEAWETGATIPAGPKPSGGDRTKASKAQLSKLSILAQELGWDDVQRRLEAGVESFTDLSKAQASDLIETWQHWVDSARGDVASPGGASEQTPLAETTPSEGRPDGESPAGVHPANKPTPPPDGPPNDAQWARAHEHIGTDAKILARARAAFGHTNLKELTRNELASLIEKALVGIE